MMGIHREAAEDYVREKQRYVLTWFAEDCVREKQWYVKINVQLYL
jgi:hypothetical protein